MVESVSQVYTWEPSNAAIAKRYGLRPEDILRFDLNTSPLAPPFLADALAGPFEPSLNEYPDSSYAELTAAAAAYLGVETSEIIVGAGADEVLDLIAKAYLSPATAALVPVPTYPMYGVLTTQRGARIVSVPRLDADGHFALDVARLVESLPGVRVVWLCSPNNPTAREEAASDLEQVLAAASALPESPVVVVDEAYFEFTGSSVVGWTRRFANLIVVRTVSKAFGMAGVRVGFGAAARPVIERLERVRAPGSISTMSAHLAARALSRPDFAAANAQTLCAERDWLSDRLATAGWTVMPSVTNFLLVRIGTHDAAEAAADTLLHSGVVPRTFGPAHPLRGHLRLTVRSRPENERLLAIIASMDDSESVT